VEIKGVRERCSPAAAITRCDYRPHHARRETAWRYNACNAESCRKPTNATVMHEINHVQHLHLSESVGAHLRSAVLGQSIEPAACHCGAHALGSVLWLSS